MRSFPFKTSTHSGCMLQFRTQYLRCNKKLAVVSPLTLNKCFCSMDQSSAIVGTMHHIRTAVCLHTNLQFLTIIANMQLKFGRSSPFKTGHTLVVCFHMLQMQQKFGRSFPLNSGHTFGCTCNSGSRVVTMHPICDPCHIYSQPGPAACAERLNSFKEVYLICPLSLFFVLCCNM